MPAEERALFMGFVLGDDRGQSRQVVDDFRASGLSHLLERGFRVEPWISLLMSDEPFGCLERYVISSPTFFL